MSGDGLELAPESEPAPTVRRTCPVCQQVRAGAVCEPCGLNLTTGELVAPPAEGALPGLKAWRPAERPPPPPRTPLGLLRDLVEEGLGGLLFLPVLGVVLLAAAPANLLSLAVLSVAMALRARVARAGLSASAESAPIGPAPVSPAPIGPALEAGEPPPPPPPDDPWRRPDLVELIQAASQAGLLTAVVGGPLVARGLLRQWIEALQQAGMLLLVPSRPWGEVLALGAMFCAVAAAVVLARRAGAWHGPRLEEEQDPERSLLPQPLDVIRAVPLGFLLLGVAQSPWVLAVVLPVFPLLLGALVCHDPDEVLPWRWPAAWRLTPYPLAVALLGGALGVVAARCVWDPASLAVPAALSGPLAAVCGWAAAVVAGVARRAAEQRPWSPRPGAPAPAPLAPSEPVSAPPAELSPDPRPPQPPQAQRS